MAYRVLSLFAGIGGFDLGLERTGGFKTVAFCEIDPFCQRVLAKHWPGVPCYDDVRDLTAERLRADGIDADCIVGGFPCQDISLAGSGAGLAGERSGLWSEYARLIGELRPSYVIVENVAALLGRGLATVLGDLAAVGYDAEWHCIPASAVGAPHRRDRLWIVAYPDSGWGRTDVAGGHDTNRQDAGRAKANGLSGAICEADRARGVADSSSFGRGQGGQGRAVTYGEMRLAEGSPLADAAGERCGEAGRVRCGQPTERPTRRGENVSNADFARLAERILFPGNKDQARQAFARQIAALGDWWCTEPAVGRVAHGVPHRVGQLRAYGNAVVPQIPELIGRAILEAEAA